MKQRAKDTSAMGRQGGSIRRGVGLAVAMSGVLVVAAGAVFVGVAGAEAAADDARSIAAVEEAAANLENLPPVEPVVPATAPADAGAPASPADSVDYSRTPEGWYDATTDPADVVIPEVDEWGEVNDGIWEAQQQLTAKCMAEQGFWYAWTNDRSKVLEEFGPLVLSDDNDAARLAKWGTNPSDQPYDWRLAGCQGYAVHVTGMDDAH